ncbi:MAG: hypothetical protein ACI8Y7_000784 [Candidatus Woesearchaeota archaeon]|jgi:hypothetical protein
MKKRMLLIVTLTLFILAVFAFAESDKQIIDDYTLSEGWNLAYGLNDPQQIISAGSNYASPPSVEEIRNSIRLIYAYDGAIEEYVLLYAKDGMLETGEYENFNPPVSISEDIPTSSVWVLAETGHSIMYEAEVYPLLSERNIKKGWNFVPISSEIKENSINDFKGDCNIQSLYTYAENDGITQWLDLKEIYAFDDANAFTDSSASELQLVIKVENDCQMGASN